MSRRPLESRETSYRTGVFAFPNYTANIVYVFATYKFE
jgi:hypothetical protein